MRAGCARRDDRTIGRGEGRMLNGEVKEVVLRSKEVDGDGTKVTIGVLLVYQPPNSQLSPVGESDRLQGLLRIVYVP